MSKGKLTRQELGWLLTQEAQGAAERLRLGVSALTHAPPAPGIDASGVDATLCVLDDAMKMLSNLHSHPVNVRGRRGRIDLASLLWEVAPEARVSIEPGSGTEVFGDEAELRRMFHVMLGHGSGSSSAVSIRREKDEVVVSIALGPDSSAIAEAERAWLARMALRYGGRWELDGAMEVLALPAEGVDQRDDVAKLRKELDEARRQGEVYARELATAWPAADEGGGLSSSPPPLTPATDLHRAIARFSGGIAAALRGTLSPVGRDLTELRATTSHRKSTPDAEVVARAEIDDRLESIRRRLLAVQELVSELGAIGESDSQEPRRDIDLSEVVRGEVNTLEGRAERAGVKVRVRAAPIDSPSRPIVHVPPRAAGVLIRELVAHAIAASPGGSAVSLTVEAPAEGRGVRVTVDDSGTVVPAGARRALVALEVDPGTFGRPTGVALFVAAGIASSLSAHLEIGDAPVEDACGGGMRVVVTFPA